MNPRLERATAVWRARLPRTAGDRAYIAYSLVLLGLIVVTPVARAVWLAVTSPGTAPALADVTAARAASVTVLATWSTMLVTGRSRGPAVGPPFLVHALADSDLPRREAFRPHIVRAVGVGAVALGTLASFFGAALGSLGLQSPPQVVSFGFRGVLIGMISALCWLLGQAAPRASAVLAGVLLGSAAALWVVGGAAVTGVPHLASWAWVGGSIGSPDTAVLALIAAGGVLAAPALLDRLDDATLTAQSARWATAVAQALSLDLAAVGDTYEVRPVLGRRLRVVAHRARPSTLVVRSDVVGALRTPMRLLSGALTTVGSGLLLVAAATASAAAVPLLGALAAALLYTGTGAVSRGLHHVSHVSRDQPLYGFGAAALVGLHSVFPIVTTVLVTGVTTASIGSVLAPGAMTPLLFDSVALPVIVTVARVGNALRGPLPLLLMSPAPSALGDPMPALRVLWALDAPLLAVLAGATAAGVSPGIGGLVAVCAALVLLLVVRWVRRS